MVLLSRFCFWFSIRLGSLIVGTLTIVQCSVWFMISIISLDNLDVVREALDAFVTNLKLENSSLNHIARDPHIYLIVLNVGVSLLLISTILMIVGAFKCKYKLLIPFLLLDFVYIVTVTLQFVFLMINYRKKESGKLGALILYSNAGGFVLAYLLYMWSCVLSFAQVLKRLEGDQTETFGQRDFRKQVLNAIEINNEERF